MLSDRVKNCCESVTLDLAQKARNLQENGEAVIDFGSGDPDLKTPAYICAGAKAAIDAGDTKYDRAAGIEALKLVISKKLREDQGLDYSPEHIFINNGAKSGIFTALQAVLNPGDEVIVVRPYWLSYTEMIRLAGGVPVVAETQKDNQFKLTPEELTDAITPKTKAIILNSPTNPTGVIYSLEELLNLAEVLVRNKIIVISDEVYEEFVYGERNHISIAALNSDIKDQTIVVNGFSKTFAMTGWRLGYAAANLEIIEGMRRVQSHTLSYPSTISQQAGRVALENKDEVIAAIVNEFDERRQAMIQRLDQLPGLDYIYPESTFYVFVDIEELLDNRKNVLNPDNSAGFCEKLLETARVVAVPGEAFGMPKYIRLSFTVPLEVIQEGFDRIEKFVSQY